MHRPIFGHSFAVLVAPILLSVLAFNFLNKKKAGLRKNAEDANSGASGLLTAPMGTNSGRSSSSPTETNNGALSLLIGPTGNRYGVFLSFSGQDTRKTFTDHLYNRLVNAGIRVFRDDKELHHGKKISPDLLAAIKNSKILIPILSVNYGSSKWCLDELVLIMECMNSNMEHIVLPIFYRVKPAHVRHQIGSFGDTFRTYKRHFNQKILEKWKQALIEISLLKGWEADGLEGELVNSVVQKVLRELKKELDLVIPENLVGIDSHVEKIMKILDERSSATLFVGIHGMGGIGKTTLAKTIYNELSNKFRYRSFIADIRDSHKRNALTDLQNQLIFDILEEDYKVSNWDEGIQFISSNFQGKKVLILLDDVSNDVQLKALAGNHNWFYPGSVIIITTRDNSILNNVEMIYNYELAEMNMHTSLILFSKHAFKKDAPPSEFEVLTYDVVFATGGLPLSLEILGSFLRNKKQEIWRDTRDKLRKIPHPEVQEKLLISFDALDFQQQQIFLDIACFFIGTDLRIASYMWDAYDFFPNEGIEVLRSRSLIKGGDDYVLNMHDQLRDLGRNIVRKENEKKPQDRSRLWDSEEVMKVLKRHEGTEKTEAIYLSSETIAGLGGNIHADEQFKNLTKLRFLQVSGAHFSGDFKNSFDELRWLRWRNCPSTFEAENFFIKELVALDLTESKISDKWQGWNFIMMAKKLKFIDLTSCGSLEGTSFLSAFENLEVLIIRDCSRLEYIHSSIGDIKSLIRLDLGRCWKLEELPNSIGALQNLEILSISHTKIKKLPTSIGRMEKLRELNTYWCRELQSLPALPSSLTYLHVTCQNLKLSSLLHLTHLKKLYLSEVLVCPFELPSSLHELSECSRLANAEELELQKSPNISFKLEILDIYDCGLKEVLDVAQLNHLRRLSVVFCINVLEVRGLDRLKYLESLTIKFSNSIQRLDLSKSIIKLCVESCKNLVEIQGLHRLELLEELSINKCTLIKRLDLPESKGMKMFNAKYCKNLVDIQGLDKLESLKEIDIFGCNSIQRLYLPKSKCLMKLPDGSSQVRGNAEDTDISAFDSMAAPIRTIFSGSSSSSTKINNGASSSSIAPTEILDEVFLSFNCSDTRSNFISHLYNGLVDAGIRTFRDHDELPQGEKIGPEILGSLRNSKIMIPVLSMRYGTSSWCMDELVQMMECKDNNTGCIVLPIFYKVKPAHVQYQIGSFGEAFHDREMRLRMRAFDPRILEQWKLALSEVSSLKGFNVDGYESIESIVQQVLFELKKKFELIIPEKLVEIESHVEKVMKFVDNNSHATLFVGIHRMGGIGKTTLAKTMYNMLSNQFEHCSFIADIRESCKHNGIYYLQNQLINDILKQENQVRNEDEGIKFLSSMLKDNKVLILLDDVDDDNQLKALAGSHNWFSEGSVIIIATRDESILDKAYVDKKLDKDKYLILFSRHAF